MPDIRHSINLLAPAEALRRLSSTGDGLTEWWAEDVQETPDGTVILGFFNRATVYHLRPIERSAARVVWRCETGKEWEGTELVFAIAPEGAGVRLDFVHGNWQTETPYFVSCNTTWGGLMFRLRAAAEGRKPGPLFLRNSLAY